MMRLRSATIRLAYEHRDLRAVLLPLVASKPRPQDLDWSKTQGGYEGLGGRVVIDLKSKTMTVDGKVYKLPRRPTFDHAEGILTDHYGW